MKAYLLAGVAACGLLSACADPSTFSTDVTNLTQNAGAVAAGSVTVANEIVPVVPVIESTACLLLQAVGGSWKACAPPTTVATPAG